ncbi:MAG: T9SS type A sorting domain-containing protein [Calditrichaeota bacterium]|nr:T9SS type A sorting domain-containing protein [Calditrichota bacterium]
MKKMFLLLLCLGLSTTAFAQFNAILINTTPLTHDCFGDLEAISHGYFATIVWDQNDNGPDPSDLPPIVGSGFGQCNFNQIDMGTGEDLLGIPGGFATDPAFTISTTTPMPSRYYVVVDGPLARWTSAVFTIENGLNEYEVSGWVCNGEEFFCDEPTEYYFETTNGVDYWADGPHFRCLPLCANTPVQICYGPLGADVIPYASVSSGCSIANSGCDVICVPAEFTFDNNAWVYDEANSLWCNSISPGETDGCICLEDSFSVVIPPCDEPTYYYYETVGGIDYWADGPHFTCVPLCANTPVQICYGPLGADVIPFAEVRSGCSFGIEGCSSECPPAEFTFDNNAWVYDEANSLWCNSISPGETDGCICLEDSFSVVIPPCDEPTYYYYETVGGIDYWADGPHFTCVPLCANTPVQICYGPLGQDVIPYAAVSSGCLSGETGCNTECPPATFNFNNNSWTYDEANSLWCNWIVPGNADGCVCLEDSFSAAPPCDEPTYIYFETVGGIDYWADGPHSTCISLCANTPVQICYGPLDPDVFLFVNVAPGCSWGVDGCSTECPPASAIFRNDAWTYDDLTGYWCNWIYPGYLSGCICLEDGFDYTIGFVESYFEAQPRDHAVLIEWGTASESEIDYFRLLRDGQLVYTVAGTNTSVGSTYSYLDETVVNGRTYTYSIEVVSIGGEVRTWTTIAEATPSSSTAVVTEHALLQNYPNPFNSVTNFVFDVVEQNPVVLNIYNLNGELVAQPVDGIFSVGRHTVSFDANDLATGLYFYTVKIGNEFTATKKMLLVK